MWGEFMEIREAVFLWVPHFCENVGGECISQLSFER